MNRRNLIQWCLVSVGGALTYSTAGARLAPLCKDLATPAQTEGPFYPVISQMDEDSDLVQVSGRQRLAKGEVILIEGVVSDPSCNPVSGALVEIWQACESGKYNHPSDPNPAPLDADFQYWGKAVSDSNGVYRFRTILPGAYPADTDWMRPPHIHFKISRLGFHELITQMYFAGNSFNDKDLILQNLAKEDQAKVIVELKTTDASPHRVGEFNIQIQKVRPPTA